MIVGKVSSELVAALPPEVLDALGLEAGDSIRYDIDDEGVRLERAEPASAAEEAWIQARIEESLDDPRPSVPLKEAFAQVSARLDQHRRDGV